MFGKFKRTTASLLAMSMVLGSCIGFAETEVAPAYTEIPVIVNATEVPAATETPVVTEAPTVTEAPVVTEAPLATEAPAETEVPEVTETPAQTEAPDTTEVPMETEAPEATEVPVETEAPEATEVPVETEVPEATEAPAETEDPEVTEVPAETEVPEATEVPVETEAPQVTEAPAETEIPEATEVPVETEVPEATVDPSATVDPDATEMPGVFEAGEATVTPVDNSTTLPDGEYVPENFTFAGGSGKVTFSCPKVVVTGGKAMATMVISSTAYPSYTVAGEQYETKAYEAGGMYAEIPVDLNVLNTIYAYSSKMAVNIEYTFTITLSETAGGAGQPEAGQPGEGQPGEGQPEEGDDLEDGKYDTSIESDFSMFKITSQSATIKNGVVTVSIATSKNTYDKFHFGTYADRNEDGSYTEFVQGVKKDGEEGYTFTFTLPKSYMGQKVAFVPGKPNGSWYEGKNFTNQYYMTIPTVKADDKQMEDGKYDTSIESDFSMFKITSQSATIKNGVVTVTIATSKNTYDKFHFGTYADRNEDGSYTEFVQGVKKDGEDGYTFTFTLPKSYMGQKVAFVPGKPNGSWYEGKNFTNQYYMTIPTVKADDKQMEDGKYDTSIESDFSMFKITSQSATIKNGVVTVTIATSKNTYDKFHFGTYADRNEDGSYTEFVQGEKKEGEDGYTFTFTLPKSYMGQKVAFVPGKPNGSWYEGKNFTNQYYMTIPTVKAEDKQMADGKYETTIESDFSMFKITSQSATVKDGVVTVTIATSKNTYDKFHFGTYADRNEDDSYTEFVQGEKKDGEEGYTFTFTLPKSYMGQKMPFVPGKPNGSWYEGKNFTNQYYMTIPTALGDAIAPEPDQPSGGDEGDVADGDYIVDAETWKGLKVKETQVKLNGENIEVTLISEQLSFDAIYLGLVGDADKSNCVKGRLVNGNTAFAFTFTLPKSALGTTLNIVLYNKAMGMWMDSQFTLVLPDKLNTKVPEADVNINDYADGEYIGSAMTYNKEIIDGQEAYNSNAGFSPAYTKIVVNGDILTVTFTCDSCDRVHYDPLFIGSLSEVSSAPESAMIKPYTTPSSVAGGVIPHYTFTLPRSALGQMVTFCSYSVLDGKWYEFVVRISDRMVSKGGDEGEDQPGDAGLTDGDYTAKVESMWSGLKIKETRIKVKGETMEVTLISEQLNYDAIYIGKVTDADKTNCVKGKLVNKNTAYAFTFTLPTSALGTTVEFAARSYSSGDWMKYQYDFTLPEKLDAATPEVDIDINDYKDGKYIGSTMTYNKVTIDGEDAYNNNAAFAPAYTEIEVVGDALKVTFTCTSAQKVSYPYIFIGTKAAAANAPESEMITCYTTPSSVPGGIVPHYTFTLPRTALGQMITIACYSATGEKWYEYVMLISEKLVSNEETPDPDQPGEGEQNELDNGDYTVEVESSASMFKVVSCILTARDGKYTARIALSGTGYDKLFMGSAEDAAKADASSLIGYTINADGLYEFVIPVEKLDTPISVAAHSARKDTWYDRELTFKSEGAKKVSSDLSDGDYTTNVESSASMFKVVSCILTVKNGKYTARIALSGTGYDKLFMGSAEDAAKADASSLIGYTINADGLYEFVVPVEKLDTPISVAAHSARKDTWYDRELTFKSEGMTQVAAGLENGNYSADVETSASMFKVIACVLTVKDGKYTAKITLSGTGYDKLFMGSAESAAKADENSLIGYTVNADGKYDFVIPVEKLDEPIALAAHALKSDTWFDRTITIKSDSLKKLEDGEISGGEENPNPDDGKVDEPTQKPEADLSGSTSKVDNATVLPDGTYTPDKFSWSGGSGKVSLSCNQVVVENGKAYAMIVFDSPNFSYVKANGQKIFGSHTGSTSTFKIPVDLNANNRILGMTTKMTIDHEIAYTVYVYIAGAKDSGNVSEEAKAAEIIGLNYASTVENENAQMYKAYRYEGGFVAIDVAGVGRYLLAPEGVEIPVGLSDEATIIQMPVKSVYAGSDFLLEMFAQMDDETLLSCITSVGMENTLWEAIAQRMANGEIAYGGASDALNYAALLKTSCDLVILPETFAIQEGETVTAEKQAMIDEMKLRLGMLEIPAFVDCSALEETEAGRLEWIKVYGMIFGCEEQANALYARLVAALPEASAAA